MKVIIPFDSYKGVDGSSLSDVRCSQIIQVYEMLENLGSARLDYLKLQEEVDRRKLFGDINNKSAIRTFFPLLKKLHFVNYDGIFNATNCFTELGVQFVFTSRALLNIRDDTPHKKEIENKLMNVKRMIIKQGLIYMNHDPDYSNHNIWIALKMLLELDTMHWNEFLYMLYCNYYGYSFKEAIEQIKEKEKEIKQAEFVKEDGTSLPNTCYSYIRSLLEEAHLIEKTEKNISKIIDRTDSFYYQITI